MKKFLQVSLLSVLSVIPASQVFAHAGSHSMTTMDMISHLISSPFHVGVIIFILLFLAFVGFRFYKT